MLQRLLTLVLTGLLMLPPWACPCHLLGEHAAAHDHSGSDADNPSVVACSGHTHADESGADKLPPAAPNPEHDEPCEDCIARSLTIAHFARATVGDAPDLFIFTAAAPVTLVAPELGLPEASALAFLIPFPDKSPVYLKLRALLL